jgi:hypothetical protein
MSAGLALFVLGVVCQTIGGLLAMNHLPEEYNDAARAKTDPVRKGIQRNARLIFDLAAWRHPSTKWWFMASIIFVLSTPLAMWLTR